MSCIEFAYLVYRLFHNNDSLSDNKQRNVHLDYSKINLEYQQDKNQIFALDPVIDDFKCHLQS